MDTKEKIELANRVLGDNGGYNVEVLKQDGSLIERKNIEKVILTSDNRELLLG